MRRQKGRAVRLFQLSRTIIFLVKIQNIKAVSIQGLIINHNEHIYSGFFIHEDDNVHY